MSLIKIFRSFVLLSVGTFSVLSCDDGRIYEELVDVPEEGRVVQLTGHLSGLGNWSDRYSVVVAGYDDESDYAIITKAVPQTEGGEVKVVLSGISDEVSRIDLCVINRLRKRMLSFRSFECPYVADTIRLDVGTLDVGMYSSIQSQLFDKTCANCHGASTFAAAGLYLTPGKSYAALVGQPSAKFPEILLVSPGDADESLLYQTLSSSISQEWSYDHTKEVLSDEWKDIIEDWIDDGAHN